MKRLIVTICIATAGGSAVGLTPHPALAAGLCVGSGPGCFTTIQQALSAAQNGDVIQLGAGTYPGPITIATSVKIVGAGAGVTTIQGGGPVVTIGSADAVAEPTVSITGVTITGGANTSIPEPSQPRGGGVWVPPAADGGPGATVTISDSVITGNTVRASAVGGCGGSTCSLSRGGGIASFGTLTLINTAVSNNEAIWHLSSGAASAGVSGGGIRSYGVLTLRGSTVSGNTARLITTGVSGDFNANGGGMTASGPLTMDGSSVRGNRLLVTTPSIEAYGGGVHTTGDGSATIRNSLISDNIVDVTASGDEGAAVGGGIEAENSLVLLGSTVRDNQTRSSMPSAPPDSLGGAPGAGIQLGGPSTIRDSTVTGNRGTVTGTPTRAYVAGAALDNEDGFAVTVADSTITDNAATATTSGGTAIVWGAAVHNNGDLTLRNTVVRGNTGIASGLDGMAQGGGVWNDSADLFFGPPGPPAHLSLYDSTITRNRLSASSSITPQGGGVYNGLNDGATVRATDSAMAQNVPDQCFGC